MITFILELELLMSYIYMCHDSLNGKETILYISLT